MLQDFIYLGVVLVGFAAIMNPIAVIPLFLTLTSSEDDETTKKIAFNAVLTALIIVMVFSFAGHFLLEFFNVTFTALRLTGGIIVALIGYEMLNGELSSVSHPKKETIEKTMKEEGSVAITPLGIPLLAGPGVIITAMNFSSGGYNKLFITICSFGILCAITYYTLINGKKIKKFIGASALKVITKMMGLILAVIGMQMLIEGVNEVGRTMCRCF